MTSRFKTALAALIGLAATAVVVALLLGAFDSKTETNDGLLDPDGREVGSTPEGALRASGNEPEGGNLTGTGPGVNPVSNGAITPGMRTPHGQDLSTEEGRSKAFEKLAAMDPIDWAELTRVLAVTTEALPTEIRELLLKALQFGPRTHSRKAFDAVHDSSMAPELLSLLDDSNLDPRARDAVLQAVSTMPGANADEVALGLEARLADDLAKDRLYLRAIATRGGLEGTRAILDYIRRMDEPGMLSQGLLQGLDLSKSPDAQELVAEALARDDWTPAALRQVLGIAQKQGVTSLTSAIIALDKSGQDDGVRREAITTLSRIGGKEAVEYLLKKAAEPGVYGEHAVTSLNVLARADKEGQQLLITQLDSAATHPRPDEYRAALLRAIGNVRAEGAADKIVPFLGDRSPGVQIAAIRALGRLGPKAAEKHVPAIVDQWPAADEAVKVRIVITLGTIGGKEAVKAMDQMLSDEALSKGVRRNLIMGLNSAKKRLAGNDAPVPPGGPSLGGGMGPNGGR